MKRAGAQPDQSLPCQNSLLSRPKREAEGCPDPAGAGGVRGQAHATELPPGRLKDEFYRNRTWRSFEGFKRDLDAYTVHWNKRRQVKQKGLTPEEFRNQSPCAA